MPFAPNILVVARDATSIALVVDVELRIADLPTTEEQLKRYMVHTRCPVGMLVTPEKLRLYRDTYTGYNEDSIKRVGEFSMSGVLDPHLAFPLRAPGMSAGRPFQLEEAVQAWLEGLARESVASTLPSQLREAVEEYIVPALMQGEVRAAGPRWRSNGS